MRHAALSALNRRLWLISWLSEPSGTACGRNTVPSDPACCLSLIPGYFCLSCRLQRERDFQSVGTIPPPLCQVQNPHLDPEHPGPP